VRPMPTIPKRNFAKPAKKVTGVLALIALTVAVPLVAGAVGVAHARDTFYTTPPGQLPPHRSGDNLERHDPTKPTAVVLLGNGGTNAADTLPPFEVLAASGAFNVYTVAEQRRLVPLVGGLDIVPDLSFAELRALLGSSPQVIVVPQIEGEPTPDSPIIRWLRDQRRIGDPIIVSVCVGAEIVAEAGLLDGRPATSHWLGLIGLRRSHPDVQWRDDVRYVDDGDIITSAGVLSGIDGTLRAVERLAGQEAAARAAGAVHWPYYSPAKPAHLTPPHIVPADSVALLSAAYRWDRERLGVLLTDGVTETELASAFRGYTELNFLADPLALTADGRPVRSKHGLAFVPRAGLQQAASRVDRIIVPGATGPGDGDRLQASGFSDIPVSYPHARPGFAFNGILEDIAEHHDTATARWAAKSLQYPTAGLDLDGSRWPWTITVLPILLIALGVAGAVTVTRLVRRASRDRHASPAEPAATPLAPIT
jgi:putative intracellular protease/amidase